MPNLAVTILEKNRQLRAMKREPAGTKCHPAAIFCSMACYNKLLNCFLDNEQILSEPTASIKRVRLSKRELTSLRNFCECVHAIAKTVDSTNSSLLQTRESVNRFSE